MRMPRQEVSSAAGVEFLLLVHPGRANYHRPTRLVEGLLASPLLQDVRQVDLREHYRARGLTFDDIAADGIGHLSVRGHRMAAEIIEELLATTPARSAG